MKVNSEPRPESLEAIADRLKSLRLALGIDKQAEFCRRFELSTTQWNNYEKAVSRIRVDEAIMLVQSIGITLDWIYLGNERWMPFDLMNTIKSQKKIA